MSDDRITTIRDALIWAQSYAPRALCHRLIDAEEALGSLAADLAAAEARATEAEQAADYFKGRVGDYANVAETDRVRAVEAERERDKAVARANTLAELLDDIQWCESSVIDTTEMTVTLEAIPWLHMTARAAALGEAHDD